MAPLQKAYKTAGPEVRSSDGPPRRCGSQPRPRPGPLLGASAPVQAVLTAGAGRCQLPSPPAQATATATSQGAIMQLCHFCGMHSLFQVLYCKWQLYKRHTKLPGRKCARPPQRCGSRPQPRPGPFRGASALVQAVLTAGAGRGQLPAPPAQATATATSQGAARPSSPQARPRPPALAAASTHRRRHCVRLLRRCRPRRRRPPWPHPARSLASLFWTASSPLQSPQVAPAAATSASALQASKYYSRKADESILLGWGGVYVTVPCNLEFCTNVRSPCNVPPRVAEVWCMGHKAIRVRIYVSVFVTSQVFPE